MAQTMKVRKGDIVQILSGKDGESRAASSRRIPASAASSSRT